MTWQDVDLFRLQPMWFSDELRGVVVQLFDEGSEAIARWERERKDSLKKMLVEAKDEIEEQTALALADLEDSRNRQRGQVLGAAGLHYLYSALMAALKELGRYFNRSHPRSPEGYKGKSQLDRIRGEYARRFGLDLGKSPLFGSVIELVLARNAGIHPGVETLSEYCEKVKSPRFCTGGEFHVGREAFLEILGETEKFFEWVVKTLVRIRRAAAGKA